MKKLPPFALTALVIVVAVSVFLVVGLVRSWFPQQMTATLMPTYGPLHTYTLQPSQTATNTPVPTATTIASVTPTLTLPTILITPQSGG